eukprot:scaffold88005_cov45-Phaeocystis_antarctica.AAC.1
MDKYTSQDNPSKATGWGGLGSRPHLQRTAAVVGGDSSSVVPFCIFNSPTAFSMDHELPLPHGEVARRARPLRQGALCVVRHPHRHGLASRRAPLLSR